ncbi:hypothetical protein J2Y60_001297 [Arcicella sp. BE140]|nr:hypothetical protein [Arcicella sp. BE51]MDR6811108.1 hypothetical protein [Arcicella sp. BE140]MDR6822458.1 hypothetical protein [Arcicella sp. BE139]
MFIKNVFCDKTFFFKIKKIKYRGEELLPRMGGF